MISQEAAEDHDSANGIADSADTAAAPPSTTSSAIVERIRIFRLPQVQKMHLHNRHEFFARPPRNLQTKETVDENFSLCNVSEWSLARRRIRAERTAPRPDPERSRRATPGAPRHTIPNAARSATSGLTTCAVRSRAFYRRAGDGPTSSGPGKRDPRSIDKDP